MRELGFPASERGNLKHPNVALWKLFALWKEIMMEIVSLLLRDVGI